MTMQQKRSATPSKVPEASDLADGQIAMNTADGLLFIKKADNSVIRIGAEMSAAVATTLREPTLAGFRAALGVLGDGQTWQDMSGARSVGVTYPNDTGRPIMLAITAKMDGDRALQVSADGSSWVAVGSFPAASGAAATLTAIVPPGHSCRALGTSATLAAWLELR